MLGFDALTTSLFVSTSFAENLLEATTVGGIISCLVTRKDGAASKKRKVSFFAEVAHGSLIILLAIPAAILILTIYHSLVVTASSGLILFFYTLPAVTLLLAVGVTTLKQPTHSLLCLIGVFFSTVLLYLYVGAEFLAFLFLIVYVGAIAILFLFVIMLLHLKETVAAPAFVTTGAAALFMPAVGLLIFSLEDMVGYSLAEFFTLSDQLNAKAVSSDTSDVN